MSKSRRRRPYHYNAILFGAIGTVVLFITLYFLTGWQLYFIWIMAISVTTFALFGVDKTLSKTDRARIPESVLHLFTLLGGFPGQIAGRLVFHHKTNFQRHPSFNIVLVISILIQAVIIYFLFLR